MSQSGALLDPSRIFRTMSPRAFARAMRFFPPIRNTGVRVKISDDWRAWRLRLPLGLKTRNYVGTHFGGTLYSAADPHLMLAWMHILGDDYIVWDKAASIRFKRPGKGTLHADFEIPEEEVASMRALAAGEKRELEYTICWHHGDEVVAEVDKTIYVRRR